MDPKHVSYEKLLSESQRIFMTDMDVEDTRNCCVIFTSDMDREDMQLLY